MQKVSYIFSYICCLLRQRLIKILIFRKKFRRGPNYCSDFFNPIFGPNYSAQHLCYIILVDFNLSESLGLQLKQKGGHGIS